VRYVVVTAFAVKTKKAGALNLFQGQVIELAEECGVIIICRLFGEDMES